MDPTSHLDQIREEADRQIAEFIRTELRNYPVAERIKALNTHSSGILTPCEDGRIEFNGTFLYLDEVFPEYEYEYEEDEWGHEFFYLAKKIKKIVL